MFLQTRIKSKLRYSVQTASFNVMLTPTLTLAKTQARKNLCKLLLKWRTH